MTCSQLLDLDAHDNALSSDDADEQLLTQPPLLTKTVRVDVESVPFLDSVHRIIDNESDFNQCNTTEYYGNPSASPSIVIPDYISSAIQKELLVSWNCVSSRSYQLEAIFHLVYQKINMMYLIRKTGEGKSLVMQGMASMLKGITICMVPLLGLGSDQEQKCNAMNANEFESFHLDEYRNHNSFLLHNHLNKYSRKEKTAIILFVSPQQLSTHSSWYGRVH